MPVDSLHPLYTENLEKWSRCRDAVEGEDAVKRAAEKYLPILGGQADDEYHAYKMRAMFYGATERTVVGLSGAVMRKPPMIEFPDKDLHEHIGQDDESIELIAQETIAEILITGRVGLYVDSAEDEGSTPFIALYYAENIINWRTDKIDGRDELVLVVLREKAEDMNSEVDIYAMEFKDQWRVLRLIGTGVDRYYQVSVWQRDEKNSNDKEDKWVLISKVVPTMMGGRQLDFIPFTFVTPKGVGVDIEKSPTLDLVNVNMSHYRTSADLEHGRHFTALPTAWVAGFKPEGKLRIGSGVAWIAEDPGAHAGYLEFTGAGLSSLSTALDQKEKLMAVLGAKLLEEQASTQETATAVNTRQAGEHSVLSNIAKAVDEGLSFALETLAEWAGLSGAVSIELNKKFNSLAISALDMQALMGQVQANLMSWDTYYFNLQRGEVYPDDWTPANEKASIKKGPPESPPLGNPLDANDPNNPGGGGGDPSKPAPPAKGGKGGVAVAALADDVSV